MTRRVICYIIQHNLLLLYHDILQQAKMLLIMMAHRFSKLTFRKQTITDAKHFPRKLNNIAMALNSRQGKKTIFYKLLLKMNHRGKLIK